MNTDETQVSPKPKRGRPKGERSDAEAMLVVRMSNELKANFLYKVRETECDKSPSLVLRNLIREYITRTS